MIGSIRHKRLRQFWADGNPRGLNADWLAKLRRLLDALEAAEAPEEMNLPGLRFHALTGDQIGRYSVRLSANFRVTFGWSGKHAIDLDIEDYH